MLERMAEVERRYEEISSLLADPAVIGEPNRLREISREHSQLSEAVAAIARYRRIEGELAGAREMVEDAGADEDLRQLAEEEAERLEEDLRRASEELKLLLMPRDPLDDRDAVVEIR